MQSKFIYSKHYKLWNGNYNFFSFSILICAQILHLFLLLFGFKKVKYFLDLCCNGTPSQFIMSESEAKCFREMIRHKFRKMRKSKMFFCNCFSTSIILWFILKRQGLQTQLRIGTKKVNHEFKAHSWVEIDRIPLNGSLEIRKKYQTFNYNFSHNTK